jgi:valyl-tRNA synthetase
MSKSLGNSPDPLDLIKKYSADGVRVGMLLSSPAGNDLLFDESLSEQGRNFGNKIWNAFRLVKSWDVKDADQPEYAVQAIKWFEQRLNQEIKHINELFDGYRISDALMAVYRLFWDDFSSWYLEAVKPAFQKPVDSATYQKTIGFFEELLKLLHPFMPFITEEIWHYITERDQSDCIMIARQNTGGEYDQNSIDQFELVKEITAGVRTIRNQKNIPNREQLTVKAFLDKNTKVEMSHVLEKLANLESFEFVSEKIEGALSFRVKANELYVPMDGIIDVDEEIRKIKEELKYQNGFLKSVLKKLGNERFVNNAPEAVVEKEKSKKTDAETKISLLEDRLKGFKSQ